jgi:hypothetical protein
MLIHKIVLSGGQIALREELRSEAMNPALLALSGQVMSVLRAGAPFLSVPISLADGSEIQVSLGTTRSQHAEERRREEWKRQFPQADLAEYEIMRKAREEKERRTSFGLTYEGIRAHYRLVVGETLVEDAAIREMVAGASRCRGKMEEEKIDKMAQEIVNLKPAFLPPQIYAQSVIGDHFAVAMLLAEKAAEIELERAQAVLENDLRPQEDPEELKESHE